MNNPRRILLLGGDGFMGRALGTRLCACGHVVHTIKRSVELDNHGEVVTHGGGMENIELLRRLLPEIDTVVHMASATTPGLSGATPSLEASLNLAPTLAVLEELQQHPGIHVIYLSSGGTVYGNPGQSSATESTPIQPLSYYGAGKLAIEEFLRCFQRLAGNPVTILRPSNVYGPGQPRYQGFAVIRTMLQHLRDGSTMSIWGDGSVVRDFIHIEDVVAALERVLTKSDGSGTFNVGSGIGHSLNDLKAIIEKASGKQLHVSYEASRDIDVQRIVLDSSAMQKRFGWVPQISLATGIEDTWKWLCTQ